MSLHGLDARHELDGIEVGGEDGGKGGLQHASLVWAQHASGESLFHLLGLDNGDGVGLDVETGGATQGETEDGRHCLVGHGARRVKGLGGMAGENGFAKGKSNGRRLILLILVVDAASAGAKGCWELEVSRACV